MRPVSRHSSGPFGARAMFRSRTHGNVSPNAPNHRKNLPGV